MFDRPPRESERRSWTHAILWAGLIFITIPFVRVITTFVREAWGSHFFTYGVAFIVCLAAAGALLALWRRLSIASVAWILGLSALVIYLTLDLAEGSPEEAIHYVQYGILSLLIFRAFAHRVRDYGVYVATVLAGSVVGMIDETIQWLTPERSFDFRDVWLNFTAVALVQLGLGLGVRPPFISGWPGWGSLGLVSYLAAASVAYLGLCTQNTPDRIAWYAARIPFLGFIDPNRNIMAEYGYLHGDAAPMQFRSRLSLEQLARESRERAGEGARILDRYRERERYAEFLETYSPLSDPFLHEARVHLFRRDVLLERAHSGEDGDEHARSFATAYWENRILEEYFTETLRASSYRWPAELEAKVLSNAQADAPYESWVSRHLIVGFTRTQLAWFFLTVTMALLALGRYSSRRAVRDAPQGGLFTEAPLARVGRPKERPEQEGL